MTSSLEDSNDINSLEGKRAIQLTNQIVVTPEDLADINYDEERQTEEVFSSSIPSIKNSFLGFTSYWLDLYFKKWLGVKDKLPPNMTRRRQIIISSILAFIGIFSVSSTDYWYLSKDFHTSNDSGVVMLTAAYAATAVLVYEAYQSPLAQPRNVIGGYLVTSIVGVCVRKLFCDVWNVDKWISCAIAVSFALCAMNLTKTVHPPCGGCAMIAVVGGPAVHSLGFGYVLTSVGAACMLVLVALIGNNLVPSRQYPLYWW